MIFFIVHVIFPDSGFLFIRNRESESYRKDVKMRIGVMKDEKLKFRNLHVSDTLDSTRNWNT